MREALWSAALCAALVVGQPKPLHRLLVEPVNPSVFLPILVSMCLVNTPAQVAAPAPVQPVAQRLVAEASRDRAGP